MKKSIYQWDHHSDQPHIIRDKKAKQKLYKLGAWGSIKTFITSCIFLPLIWLVKINRSSCQLPAPASGIGLAVNLESTLPEKAIVSDDDIASCLEELGVKYLLLRVPLEHADALQPYLALADKFGERSLLIDILQDRAHVENPALLEKALRNIFTAFASRTSLFKIGNAINRRKWGLISIDEYFDFFTVAQNLKESEFPNIKLLGSGIIDFELPNFIRSLLHFASPTYDGVAALLYVDRRGAPENTQLGANLLGKINWFKAIMQLSPKTTNRLYITETNWPLIGTEPYAPAVGDCMVNEAKQAAYLTRYYLLAFASGQVETVYWHQLVAPGYGLIDNRSDQLENGNPRKRRAYYALKTLNHFFCGATIEHFEQHDVFYLLTAKNKHQRIIAIWTNDEPQQVHTNSLLDMSKVSSLDEINAIDLIGNEITPHDSIIINGDVTYLIQKTAV